MRILLISILVLSSSSTVMGQCGGSCPDPENYGEGTPGTGGVIPGITTSECPRINTRSFTISAFDALPNSGGLLYFGFEPHNCIYNGWRHLVEAEGFFVVFYNGAGNTSVSFDIPRNPFLIGLECYMQFTVADPGAIEGTSASDGLKFTICE